MEGRHHPPKAEHPYPNSPNMVKFWGTPMAKAYFKALAVFVLFGGTWAGINFYLARNLTGGFYGLAEFRSLTPELMEEKRKFNAAKGSLLRTNLSLVSSQGNFEFDKQSKNLFFKDEVKIVAPPVKTVLTGPQGVMEEQD